MWTAGAVEEESAGAERLSERGGGWVTGTEHAGRHNSQRRQARSRDTSEPYDAEGDVSITYLEDKQARTSVGNQEDPSDSAAALRVRLVSA